MKTPVLRALLAALCTLTLAGCIDSAKPILTDSQPVLGQHLRLQLFSLRKGHAYDPEQAEYTWNGQHYVHASGGMRDITGFSVHPFEGGDYIVQTAPEGSTHVTEYAWAHTLVDGVFQVIPIDEDDASDSVRAANCPTGNKITCRIETRDQLFNLARATAARRKKDGGLAILLPDRD